MNTPQEMGIWLRWLMGGAGLAVATYAVYVAITWLRYGHPNQPGSGEDADPLIERFLPVCDVAMRHHMRIAAPAEITFGAACDMDLMQSAIIRCIFQVRALILRSSSETALFSGPFLAQSLAQGWGVLAEVPRREIVVGAVTQPWAVNPVFRALPPDEFAAFHEPGHLKIVWTLRADLRGTAESVYRTETRVATTDLNSRAKFRTYWSLFSPGIVLIRHISLRLVRTAAERRSRRAGIQHTIQNAGARG